MTQVEVRHGDVSGFGEAAPIEHYDADGGVGARLARAGRDSATTPGRSTRSGTTCRRASRPRGRRSTRRCTTCRGSSRACRSTSCSACTARGPPTSWTVWLGDPDDMARRAEKAQARGFKRLKLKLGGGDGLDLQRVQAVHDATDLPLQVDVNEYWTLDEALELLPQMPLQYCEQPLPAGDPDGPELKRRSPGADLRRRGLPHARGRRLLRRAGTRDQHQAREVRRHPRSRPHGQCGPSARPRGDARLHGRIRPRHRGRAPTSRASATTSTSTGTC